jgi:hypothetical protein
MNFIDWAFNHWPDANGESAWAILNHSGPIALVSFYIGLAFVPLALAATFCLRQLAWSLLVSGVPFAMGSVSALFVALGMMGFMSPPGPDDIVCHLILQTRLVLGGMLISLVLALISFFACRGRAANPES